MYIIEDWTGQHVYKDKQFNSFEEARDFISEIAHKHASQLWQDGTPEYEEEYNGICEDLYAEKVKK